MAVLGDCYFVTAEVDIPYFPNVAVTKHLGLVTFDKPDGTCYWYNEFEEIEDVEGQIRWYFDKLGSDWEVARGFAYATPVLGFFLFWYSLSLCCSAQVRGIRYVMAFVLSVLMTTFQGLTFLVYGSEVCEEYNCEFSRSSGFSVTALCCWFISGLCFLFMSDFPGEDAVVQKSEDGVDEESPPAVVPPPQESTKSAPGEKDHDSNEEEDIEAEPNESQTEPQSQEAVAEEPEPEPEPAGDAETAEAVDAEAEVIEVEATGRVVTDKADAAPLN
jgi:hypothetical protein